MQIINQLIIEADKRKIKSKEELALLQREFCKKNNISFFPIDKLLNVYKKLVNEGKIKSSVRMEELLRLKSIRSSSGIVVVSVLTKPFPCPGNCLYCPTEKNAPKSYLDKEPAVMRAIMCNYDPYLQTQVRLKALEATGHPIDKVSIRIIGGTWSFYPKRYQTNFIKRLFQACNEYNRENNLKNDLYKLQEENEEAKVRIVELSVETRQDYITQQEILRLRKLGVTKVELGVQSIYDNVLKINRRGHAVETTIEATKLLKEAGFKVSYQVMPNLPGSSFQKDLEMFKKLFSSEDFMPDHLKIYPLAVLKEAPVYSLYKSKKFKPYDKEELVKLIKSIKQLIPYWCRIERVIRDIPSENIVEGGAKISNLRQIIHQEMAAEGIKCKCIRCREVRNQALGKPILYIEKYKASGSWEYFLSYEDENRTRLYSMLRLRILEDKNLIKVLENAAIIREIHTYGQMTKIDKKETKNSQHQGLGKLLIEEAEKISLSHNKYKLVVIAGIGVRGYFRKLGFQLKNTYMIKCLNKL